jgi:hypothetical protein
VIDRRQHRFNGGNRLHSGGWRPRDHEYFDAELACRLDLRISRRTAAVLGHKGIDAMGTEQRNFAFNTVGTAIENELEVGKNKRRLDRIDASNEVRVLGGGFGAMGFLAPDCQKNPARGGAKPLYRFRDGRNRRPPITRLSHPFRPAQGECGNARCSGGLTGTSGDASRERMRCIDQKVETTITQKGGQTFGTTKTTYAQRNWLIGGFLRSTSKREQGLVPASALKRFSESARFASASEHQDADFDHV